MIVKPGNRASTKQLSKLLIFKHIGKLLGFAAHSVLVAFLAPPRQIKRKRTRNCNFESGQTGIFARNKPSIYYQKTKTKEYDLQKYDENRRYPFSDHHGSLHR